MHWRQLVADWKISLLVLAGVCLGVVLFGGVVVMYDATNHPFASQGALGGEGAVQVTPRVRYGLDEALFGSIRDAARDRVAVPVVDGLTQLANSDGSLQGVVLVGSDCRIEAFVGDFGCGRLLEEMDERGRSGSGEGARLVVSHKTAAALGLEAGDSVGVPGGRFGEAVVDQVVDESDVAHGSLAGLNNGFWAVGSVPDVQDLLRVGPHLSRVLLTEDIELPAQVAAVASVGNADSGAGVFLRLSLQVLLLIAALALIGSVLIAGNTYALAVEGRRRQLALVSVVGLKPGRILAGLAAEGALIGAAAGLLATAPAWFVGAWLAGSWGRDLLSGIGATVDVSVWLWWLPLLCLAVGVGVGALAALPAAWRFHRASHSGLLRSEVQTTMMYRARRTYLFIPVGLSMICAGLLAGWMWGRGDWPFVVGLGGVVSLVLGVVVLVFGATPAVMLAWEWIFAQGRAAGLLTASDLATDPLRWSTVVVVMAVALTVGIGSNALRHMTVASLVTNISAELDGNLFVHPRMAGEQAYARFDETVLDDVAAVDGVDHVTPQYLTVVDSGGAPLNVMATDPEDPRQNLTFEPDTDEPAVWKQVADGEVVVSVQVARRFGLEPGGVWELPTVEGPHGFEVAAIADAGFTEDNGIEAWAVVSPETIGRWWGTESPAWMIVTPDRGQDPSELADRVREEVDVVRLSVLDQGGVAASSAQNGARFLAPGEKIGFVMLLFATAAVSVFLLLALAQRERQRSLLRWIGYRRSLEWLNLLAEIAVVGAVAYVFGVAGAWLVDWFMSLASQSLLASRVEWAVVPESLLVGGAAVVALAVVATSVTWTYASRLDVILNARAHGSARPSLAELRR